MSTTSPESQATGTLYVTGPLPTAELNIYDQVYTRLAHGVGSLEIDLPAGIYEVETINGGERSQKLARVQAGQEASVYWEAREVRFPSAAPLSGTSTTDRQQENLAIEWSRAPSMPGAPVVPSRLFVFVRTLIPDLAINFYHGLRLLDGKGKLLSDFSTGVHHDQNTGCIAVTADLEPGFYLLYRGGRGRPARYQPIWLSPYYETQVFIPAGERPNLEHASVFMAELGRGFDPDDEAALAAESVLAGLQRGVNLASSQQIRRLLSGKFKNPWLGILALHAMRLEPESEEGSEEMERIRNLRSIVLHNTKDMLGDHPDLRALALKSDKPADVPFDYPPLLWASLKLIQEHASRHAETVPPDSLTARIFDGLVSDSSWVAWRTLPRPRPVPPPDTESPAVKKIDLGGISWQVRTGTPETEDELDFLDLLFSHPGQPEADPLLAELVQVAERLPYEDGLESVTYPLDPQNVLSRLDAEQISQSLNLPISYVQSVLEKLRLSPQLLAEPKMMTPTQNTLTNYALQQAPQREVIYPEGEVTYTANQAQNDLAQIKLRLAKLPRLRKEHKVWVHTWVDELEEFISRLDSRQDAIMISDREMKVVYVNRAIELLGGFVPGEGELYKPSAAEDNPLVSTLHRLPLGRYEGHLQHKADAELKVLTQRVAANEESSGQRFANLFKVRPEYVSVLNGTELENLKQEIESIRLYISMAGYGDRAKRAEYLESVGSHIASLKELLA